MDLERRRSWVASLLRPGFAFVLARSRRDMDGDFICGFRWLAAPLHRVRSPDTNPQKSDPVKVESSLAYPGGSPLLYVASERPAAILRLDRRPLASTQPLDLPNCQIALSKQSVSIPDSRSPAAASNPRPRSPIPMCSEPLGPL